MKCLTLQLHGDRDPVYSAEQLWALLKSMGHYPEWDRDEEHPGVVNLNFFAEDAADLWDSLQTDIFGDPEVGAWLAQVAVVVCENVLEDDEPLLLAHYDGNQALDSFSR